MPFLKSFGRLIGFACVGVPMAAMKLGGLPLLHLALGARGRSIRCYMLFSLTFLEYIENYTRINT
jgi:hypothetical protein